MKNIVVATDGSKGGQKALAAASDLAKAESAKLIIVNVVDPAPLSDELAEFGQVEFESALAKRGAMIGVGVGGPYQGMAWRDALQLSEGQSSLLRQVVSDSILAHASDKARKSGVADVETVSSVGDAANEIIRAARSTHADLIVVGRRGLGTLTEILLGSVSQKVLHRSHINVLTVA